MDFSHCSGLQTLFPFFVHYQQAIKHDCWQKTTAEELQALEANQTWDLVPKPDRGSTIRSKWVYFIKVKEDGTLDRYNAWLVAQGFKHEYEIEYEEIVPLLQR